MDRKIGQRRGKLYRYRISQPPREPAQELNQPPPSDQAQVDLATRGQAIRHVSIQAEERVGQPFQKSRTESRRLIEPPVDQIVISSLGCVHVCQRFLGPSRSPPSTSSLYRAWAAYTYASASPARPAAHRQSETSRSTSIAT